MNHSKNMGVFIETSAVMIRPEPVKGNAISLTPNKLHDYRQIPTFVTALSTDMEMEQ